MKDELLREEWKCEEQKSLSKNFRTIVIFQTVTKSGNVAKHQPTSVINLVEILLGTRVFAVFRRFKIPKIKNSREYLAIPNNEHEDSYQLL